MITIQMYEALSAKALFDKISQEKLPIKTAYKLSKIYEALEKELKFYYDSIAKISQEFAICDEGGNPIIEDGGVRIDPDKMEECQERLNELSILTLEIDFPHLNLDELDFLSLSLADMRVLTKFITE